MQDDEIPPNQEQAVEDTFDGKGYTFACGNCQRIISYALPCYCVCGELKAYWWKEGKAIRISSMDLGFLANTVRLLGERAEKYPSGEGRKKIEVALDIFYAEIASRDQETKQITGIMGALQRSLGRSKP